MKTAFVVFAFIPSVLFAQVSVSTITPASGLTRGGEIVHIHGTNLLGVPLLCPAITCSTFVKFGDTFGTIVDNTTSEIVVVAPPHAAGAVDVQLFVPPAPIVIIPSGYNYQELQSGDRVRLLLPVVNSTAGALSSSWKSDVFIHNENSEPVTLIAGSVTFNVPPLATAPIALSPTVGNSGAFVFVPKRLADNVSASIRVHDTTRDAESWGVEIPVVPESQFRRSIVLIGIPADSRFRTLLRIYSYSGNETTALVTLRDDATAAPIEMQTVKLQDGYAQLPLAGGLHPRVRVEITTASTNDPPIWAFVSITNNTTQQVTTITPAIVTTGIAISSSLPLGHWVRGGVCVEVTGTKVFASANCSGGSFDTPSVAPNGHFEADGVWEGGPGPPPPGPLPPVHFSGFVQGTTMMLIVTAGGKEVITMTVDFGPSVPCASPCP